MVDKVFLEVLALYVLDAVSAADLPLATASHGTARKAVPRGGAPVALQVAENASVGPAV